MSFLIPEEKISEIKHAADIVDVISEVVLLKRAGQNFIGLCPFHSEKTPSFTVSPDKQMFHCFGCGEGGNVFSFLMKHQGLSFPEAVRAVAGRYGIDLPVYMDKRQRKAASERQRLLNVNRQAFQFYRRQLADRRRGEEVRAYLEKRGIQASAVEKFSIGYAPPGWDNLLRYLTARGVSPTLAQTAGLVVPRHQGGGHYDRFRNRVMIPIFNLAGEVIAFGGRVLDDAEPKYLNSPETPLFNKRRTLFNLQRARTRCRQSGEVIIVEGYFDLIALDQAGVENVVATLGTALTPEHVRVLKGHAQRMVLVYDGDAAGRKAAERSHEIFGQQAVEARVAVLPEGHDPDSFVARHGVEAFRKLVTEAPGMFSFLLEAAASRHGGGIAARLRVVAELVPVLARVEDRVARSLYVRELADRLDVPERDILEKIRGAVRSGAADPGFAVLGSPAGGGAEAGDPAQDEVGGRFRIERQIVAMMVQHPVVIAELEQRRVVERFEHDDLKRAAAFLLENAALLQDEPGAAVERMEDERLRRMLTAMLVGPETWDERACRVLIDQFEAAWHRRRDDLQERIESAERSGDDELLMKLLKERQSRAEMKSVPF